MGGRGAPNRPRNAARRADGGARVASLLPDGGGASALRPMNPAAEAAAQAAADAVQRPVDGARYTYSQDEDELVLELRVPAATRAADVACTVRPASLRLAVATLPEAEREVLSGQPFGRVRPDESSWTLAGAGEERVLQLTLGKVDKTRWLGVLRSG